MKDLRIGDYLLSKRFGWQYRIISITNGAVVIQDIVRENVRLRFSMSALQNRINIGSYWHSPHPL